MNRQNICLDLFMKDLSQHFSNFLLIRTLFYVKIYDICKEGFYGLYKLYSFCIYLLVICNVFQLILTQCYKIISNNQLEKNADEYFESLHSLCLFWTLIMLSKIAKGEGVSSLIFHVISVRS